MSQSFDTYNMYQIYSFQFSICILSCSLFTFPSCNYCDHNTNCSKNNQSFHLGLILIQIPVSNVIEMILGYLICINNIHQTSMDRGPNDDHHPTHI